MKKSIITSIALSLCALTAVFCFTACGSSNNSSSGTETTAAVETTAAAETTEAAKSALIGTWDSVEAPGTYYVFNEDGTGSVEGVGYSTAFNYTDKGSKVEFIYSGMTEGQENAYTIEGDILSLTAEGGTTLTYKKTDGIQKTTESTAVPQPDSALLGTWESVDEDGSVTFNADGTGSVKANAVETAFTFVDDGSSVTMTFATANTQTSSYTIEDGKLAMTSANGEVTYFTKK